MEYLQMRLDENNILSIVTSIGYYSLHNLRNFTNPKRKKMFVMN